MRYFAKLTSLILILALTASLAVGCATYDNFRMAFSDNPYQSEDTVRIGVYEPLSGPLKTYGQMEVMGIELAHEVFPNALGKQVELIYADNEGDILKAENAIGELIAKRPAVVLGSYGSVYSLVAADPLIEAKIPAIAITNRNPLVTAGNPYYFRVCFVDSYHGVAVAKYAVEELGATGAIIVKKRDDDTATAIGEVFGEKMVQLTGDSEAILGTYVYNEGTEDFSELIEKMRLSGTNIVFMPVGVSDAAKIMRQSQDQGLNFVFLGTSDWETEELIELAGEDSLTHIAFATSFDPDAAVTEMTDVFLKAYHEKYGDDAVPDPATALGFDAYVLAVDSLNSIGTALDGDELAKAIKKNRGFAGASGTISFDSNGDPIKSVVLKSVEDGQFVNIYVMEPAFGTPEEQAAEVHADEPQTEGTE